MNRERIVGKAGEEIELELLPALVVIVSQLNILVGPESKEARELLDNVMPQINKIVL